MATASTQRLMDEHRTIEQVLAALRQAADRLEAGEPVDPRFWVQAVDFVRSFADAYHHAKEEKLLFDLYRRRGLPLDDGPVAVMLAEHDQGRAHIRRLERGAVSLAQGNIAAQSRVVNNARQFADLLTNHIYKEDHILYPLGENFLSPADEEELLRRFDAAEVQQGGAATREKYEALAGELEGMISL